MDRTENIQIRLTIPGLCKVTFNGCIVCNRIKKEEEEETTILLEYKIVGWNKIQHCSK